MPSKRILFTLSQEVVEHLNKAAQTDYGEMKGARSIFLERLLRSNFKLSQKHVEET